MNPFIDYNLYKQEFDERVKKAEQFHLVGRFIDDRPSWVARSWQALVKGFVATSHKRKGQAQPKVATQA